MNNGTIKKIRNIVGIVLPVAGIIGGVLFGYFNLQAQSKHNKEEIAEIKEEHSEGIEKNEDEIQSTKLDVVGMEKDIGSIQKDIEGINHKSEKQTELLNQMQQAQQTFYIDILKEVRK